MPLDLHSNFGYGTVTTAPSPATTGTTVVLGTATFADFPDPATTQYNAVFYPAGTIPLSSNAEIMRVVAKGTNGTINVTRQQESTSARTVIVGDQVHVGLTGKFIDDLTSGTQTLTNKTLTSPVIGTITNTDHIVLTPGTSKLVKVAVLRQNRTTDAYNNDSVVLTGYNYMAGEGNQPQVGVITTYGITFSAEPIVLVSYAGARGTSGTTYAGIPDSFGKQTAQSCLIGTTTFKTRIVDWSATNMGTGTNYFFTWTAIGVL